MKTILTIIATVGAWFFGNAMWLLALVDLVWLLVKDHILFSWWWAIGSVIGFVISIILVFISIIFLND